MKKYTFLLSLMAFVGLLKGQTSFQQQTVNVGNMGLNVSNAGTIGLPNVRNNPTGPPSMEYPINSGIEHLFEGGLWIGCIKNGNILVSTASVDDASGYSTGKSGFEYSPLSPFAIRSSLTGSNNFSTQAISHQDYIVNFTDQYTIVPGTNTPISDHTNPLFANLKLETYAWNYSYADFFVIANYEITNNSSDNWDSVYVGFWSDLVVRNVNVSTDRGAAFFAKGSVGYEDTLQAIYAYDISGDIGYTNSYGSIQYLGGEWVQNNGQTLFFHPKNAAAFTNLGLPIPNVNGNYWTYSQQAPTNDVLRYDRMKVKSNFNDPQLLSAGNRVQLMSAGPFVTLKPGEKIRFALAFVCAKQVPDNSVPGNNNTVLARTKLRENLTWARRTYDGEDVNENGVLDAGEDLDNDGKLDRFILPEPPATPKVKIITESNKVTIYWDARAEASIDPITKKKDFEGYRVYRSKPGDEFTLDLLSQAQLLQQWDLPGNSIGFNNGLQAIKLQNPVTFDGDTTKYWYKYEVNEMLNGWQYMFIVTAFDNGDEKLGLESLESSLIQNSFRTFTGTSAQALTTNSPAIGVYPNPYVHSAAWDGSSSRSRKIYFYNLPEQAEIRIYTQSGDLVATLYHNAANNNNGSSAEWFKEFAGNGETVSAGGEHAWDIMSETKQVISTGLYLFSVKDLKTGVVKTGKLAIVK